MKLPIGFNGYIDDETGEIVEAPAPSSGNSEELDKLKEDLEADKAKNTKSLEDASKKISELEAKIKDMESKSSSGSGLEGNIKAAKWENGILYLDLAE